MTAAKEDNCSCKIDVNPVSHCTGLVAEAMAVPLPSSKAASTQHAAKRSLWHAPFFGGKKSPYKTLRDVESPVKRKGMHDNMGKSAEDIPLLKTGDPTAAKYAEKLSRRNAEEDEPFVPRPNSRITFKLPDRTPSENMQSEADPQQAAATDSNEAGVHAVIASHDMIPAKNLESDAVADTADGNLM